ncbi:hypothetical protein [Streptomyces europaeiscabiei]|uniref:hypothetical protein n=1 Tax=Streptomyces europaeiscabiei TaxID=146819 RepID=UPI0038F6DC61
MGELARIRIRIEAHLAEPDRPENDVNTLTLERLITRGLSHVSEEVQEEIYQAVHQELGLSAKITVEPLVIKIGHSVEVLVILTALGSFLGTYNDLIEKISVAAEHTRRIVSRLMRRTVGAEPGRAMDVTASWTIGSAGERIMAREAQLESVQGFSAPIGQAREHLFYPLIAYVSIVTTVLLAVVGYLLGRG